MSSPPPQRLQARVHVRKGELHRVAAVLTAAVTALSGMHGARAESLTEAMSLAYDSNPTVQSQREQLRASDESAVQARAGFRPTLEADASAQYTDAPQSSLFGGLSEVQTNQTQGALAVGQTLYSGGRTTAQLRAAQAQIRADREQLRLVEAQILQGAVQAYCDVVRDRTVLALYRQSQTDLADAVKEIQARFEAGANTRADVAQAEAQLHSGEALVTSAQAQLDASVAEYVAVVGRSPGNLPEPQALGGLPGDLEDALTAGEQESPTLRQAEFADAVSQAKVDEAKASGHASLTLNGQFGSLGQAVPFDRLKFNDDITVGATFRRPLFAGGAIASQVRQASALRSAARLQVDAARRTVIQTISQVWSQRRAAQANEKTMQAEVLAAQAAFDGMRVEYRAGLRTTLDVLVAEQTLRDAQAAAAQAAHDERVADASLLAAIGRLDGRLVASSSTTRPLPDVKRIGASLWDAIPEGLDKLGSVEPGP